MASNKIREGSRIGTFFIYLIIALLAFVTIYPVWYVLILSLSDPSAAIGMDVYWLPKGLYFDSYQLLVQNNQMWRAYLNTLIYVVANTVLMLTICSFAAYGLTYKRLKFRKLVNIFLVIPMYFGGGMIPTFLLVNKLGLYNSPLALIIPSCFSVWYIILIKSYFQSLPEALREASKIDGANNYQILFKVYLPMSKPILAVISVYTIVGVWNSWFNAHIYLPTTDWQPLQLYLRRVLVTMNQDLSKDLGAEAAEMAFKKKLTGIQLRYAMIIFTTLPVMLSYPFFQKYFVKGVMLGSLKE